MIISKFWKSAVRSVGALALLVGMHSVAQAQSSSGNVTADATADIVTPISVTQTTAMNFGGVVADATNPGTVILATNNGRSVTGNALLGNGAAARAGAFAVAGEAAATFTITLPAGTVNLTHTNTINTMTVGTFVSSLAGSPGTLDGSGALSVSVGATLSVAAAQLAGHYAGTFPVTVTYN
jgi:hypothetical protein